MHQSDNPADQQQLVYKQQAAEYAVTFVKNGMTLGLGTGSTAIFATRKIGELLRGGKLSGITGFATSQATYQEAERLGIPLLAEELPRNLDLTIDGADEVDPKLNVIKGGGGALLREKIVAQASQRMFITVDDSKLSARLGSRHRLPVEVLVFGWRSQLRFLESLDARAELRKRADGSPFLTDSGNMIIDCDFGPIANPAGLADSLSRRAGIVEHGLFLGLVSDLIVAGPGGIQHRTR
ncbi:MAG TPA: ribose-5-phosphate isomerase RpiA [Terriglobales bacterium]|nr:ribose-5-phosphate isomerase RpiA [Terriglobales bacterium]